MLPVAPEQLNVGVDVVVGRYGVEDEVEAARYRCCISSALRETTTSSAPRRSASAFLVPGEVREHHHVRPELARDDFLRMRPSPPRPTMPIFLPDVTPQWRQRQAYVVIPAQRSGAA